LNRLVLVDDGAQMGHITATRLATETTS